MQVVLVYLQPFWRNSLLKCVSQRKNVQKFTKNPFWEDSRSFKVIDVDNFKKTVTMTCYDEQHVCAICNRVHAMRDNCGKITTF